MSHPSQVQARFFRPPPELRRYFTTFYYVEYRCGNPAGEFDFLHPEWANFRFVAGWQPIATNYLGQEVRETDFYVTGPSSHAVRFEFDSTLRMWGIGFLPMGWAKFIRLDAADWADALIDGNRDPAFTAFAPLAASLFTAPPDPEAELERITRFFMGLDHLPIPDEARILAIHAALVDPDVDTVAQLVQASGISQRTLERVCRRHFGFAPKLLLRRQRFLRSLADYMLGPNLKWIGALDGQYHDQAQFVRDFKQFMGMSPRQYAALDKPILTAVMHERARFAGKAVQALDLPGGGGAA